MHSLIRIEHATELHPAAFLLRFLFLFVGGVVYAECHFDEREEAVAVGAEVYGFGVSDDGTMVGFYGGAYGPRVGFLWKAGESDIQRLATAFPGATRFADYDEGYFNTPCAISADGRYIAGFAYISPDDLNEDEYYVSWVLDTQDPDAAGSASDIAPIVVKTKTR